MTLSLTKLKVQMVLSMEKQVIVGKSLTQHNL